MSSYSWPEFPCHGTENFEYVARTALSEWRENGIDIEARLNGIEDGSIFAENTIDGSVIIDGTLAPSKLLSGNSPTDGYVAVYNATSGEFDWADITGVVGADTYTVKFNAAGSPLFLEDHMATAAEAETGVVEDKLISPSTLAAAVLTMFPAGMLIPFANASDPDGWLLCDGQEVSRVTYGTLFAVIGTMYGEGNGTTTFNVPDLRGKFLRALDDEAGIDPDRVIGTDQDSDNKTHQHTIPAINGSTSTNGNHTHTMPVSTNDGYNTYRSGAAANSSGSTGTTGNHTHTVYIGANTADASGGSESRPVNVAVPYYIKY